MAKIPGKDNISSGDEHGQENFEAVGVYLPKEIQEKPQRISRARKLAEDYDLQAAFDEINDLKEEILNSERPNFSAAASLVVAKMKAKGFLEGKKTEVNITNQTVKLIELTDEQLLEIASS